MPHPTRRTKRLGVELLESRDVPSFGGPWLYGESGQVLGRALHVDPAHPAHIYAPPAILARPHPDLPGDTARVQLELAKVPRPVAEWAARQGVQVLVYRAGGVITDLPEFGALAGVETGANGDGTRTFSAVTAVASGLTAYLPADLPGPTLHELGHVIEWVLPAAARDEWVTRIMPVIDWNRFPQGQTPIDYFRLNEQEAFAQAFRQWVLFPDRLQPEIRGYFDRTFASVVGG